MPGMSQRRRSGERGLQYTLLSGEAGCRASSGRGTGAKSRDTTGQQCALWEDDLIDDVAGETRIVRMQLRDLQAVFLHKPRGSRLELAPHACGLASVSAGIHKGAARQALSPQHDLLRGHCRTGTWSPGPTAASWRSGGGGMCADAAGRARLATVSSSCRTLACNSWMCRS